MPYYVPYNPGAVKILYFIFAVCNYFYICWQYILIIFKLNKNLQYLVIFTYKIEDFLRFMMYLAGVGIRDVKIPSE